jgi:hypothetical protein
VRAVAATNPDLVVICSYPPDSVGMVKGVNEIGFKPKMIGGGMGLPHKKFSARNRPPPCEADRGREGRPGNGGRIERPKSIRGWPRTASAPEAKTPALGRPSASLRIGSKKNPHRSRRRARE